MNRHLVLEATIFYQLFADPKFFDVLPASFAVHREAAAAAHQLALKLALGQACVGCTSISAALAPMMNEFGRMLAAIQAAEPDALQPLIAYITKKRGYRPDPIFLYYKTVEGKTAKLVL
jgi:hypothetical protein